MSHNSATQWGTADAEIKDHVLRNQSSKVVPLKPGVAENIAMHASPIARDFFLELISTSLVQSPLFLSKLLPSFSCVSYGYETEL